MTGQRRTSRIVHEGDVEIGAYVDGDGPTFVILPSYGRDGGGDYDDIAGRLAQAGWRHRPHVSGA